MFEILLNSFTEYMMYNICEGMIIKKKTTACVNYYLLQIINNFVLKLEETIEYIIYT